MKKPKDIKEIDITKIRFSPEIEIELSNEKKSEKLIKRNSIIKGWCFDHDGSLDSGCEIRPRSRHKLYFNEDSLMELKEVLAVLKVHKAKVKDTCGLHIHIDMSNFSDVEVLNIIKEWIHRQRWIMKKFKVNPNRIDQYCQLLPKENLHKLTVKQIHHFRTHEVEWNFDSYSYLEDKYHSLNANHLSKGEYNTLEFRLFNGTLNFKELKECILFCLNFCKDSLERE